VNPELPEQCGKRTVCTSAGFLSLYDPRHFVNSLKNEEIRQSGFFPSFSEKFRRLKDFLGIFVTSQWNEPLQQANSLNKDLLPSSHHGTLSLARRRGHYRLQCCPRCSRLFGRRQTLYEPLITAAEMCADAKKFPRYIHRRRMG
jgi:hypothetical protein